jgi:uncharacterized protein YnzC (UPF0291/DUF896 family)
MKTYFLVEKNIDNHKMSIISDATLKDFIKKNCYREEYLDQCIKSVLNSMKSAKAVYYEQNDLVSIGEYYVCKSIDQAKAVKRIELRLMIECAEENFYSINEMWPKSETALGYKKLLVY